MTQEKIDRDNTYHHFLTIAYSEGILFNVSLLCEKKETDFLKEYNKELVRDLEYFRDIVIKNMKGNKNLKFKLDPEKEKIDERNEKLLETIEYIVDQLKAIGRLKKTIARHQTS